MVVETGAAVHDENTGPRLCDGGIAHHDSVEYDVVIAIDDRRGGDRERVGEALIHAGKRTTAKSSIAHFIEFENPPLVGLSTPDQY